MKIWHQASPVRPVTLDGNVQVALQAEQAGEVGAVGLHVQAGHLPQAPSLPQKLPQPAQHLVPRSVVPRLGLQPLHTCRQGSGPKA